MSLEPCPVIIDFQQRQKETAASQGKLFCSEIGCVLLNKLRIDYISEEGITRHAGCANDASTVVSREKGERDHGH